MENEIKSYIEIIKNSYRGWNDTSDISEQMIATFNEGISYTIGKKYIKVITRGSVHSFIMKENDKKFSKGDVLKAAGWNAPARNFARGNIFDHDSIIKTSWTGA